jgi:hypothetical protein
MASTRLRQQPCLLLVDCCNVAPFVRQNKLLLSKSDWWFMSLHIDIALILVSFSRTCVKFPDELIWLNCIFLACTEKNRHQSAVTLH